MIDKICKHCDNYFSVYPCNKSRKFCSYRCYWDAMVVTTEKTCANCGNQFIRRGGKLSVYCSKSCFISYRSGDNHRWWKGDEAGYHAKHKWVQTVAGKPRFCESCGTENAKKFEWANISGEYFRKLDDWIRLCVSCHRQYDGSAFKAWETRNLNLKGE
jgi:hypothetical protein